MKFLNCLLNKIRIVNIYEEYNMIDNQFEKGTNGNFYSG